MATKTKTKTKTKVTQPDLTSRLKASLRKEEEGWVEFALTAEEIYRTEHWRQKGYESPKAYVEKELEGKISYEIFMHRVKMGEAIRKYGLRKEQIVKMGWTKFKEIASLALADENMTTEELKEIIKETKDKSVREIKEFVRNERKKRIGGVVKKTVSVKFTLIDEQDNVLKEALALAMELAETDNQSTALTYICMDFLANHTEDSNVVRAIRDRAKEIEEKAKEAEKKVHKPHANKGRKRKLEV